jgi:SAM-dependent methyltransferase
MSMQRNPQAEQMADESMVRNLAAQAQCIWPQEQAFFARYQLRTDARIVDVGCGTGEITARLAALHPHAEVVGIDLLDQLVNHARRRHAALAPRLRFEQGDAFELHFPDAHFDLVVCRHMTQLVPEPEKVLRQLVRVCAPGGWVHVLSEDYGMLHMEPGALDSDRLWRDGCIAYLSSIHTDGRIGRRTYALLKALGLVDLRVDYVTVDTLRAPREMFASIKDAWRDGYSQVISEHTALSVAELRALFDQVSANIRDPDRYAVWQVPVISGRKPPSPQPSRAGGRGSDA